MKIIFQLQIYKSPLNLCNRCEPCWQLFVLLHGSDCPVAISALDLFYFMVALAQLLLPSNVHGDRRETVNLPHVAQSKKHESC